RRSAAPLAVRSSGVRWAVGPRPRTMEVRDSAATGRSGAPTGPSGEPRVAPGHRVARRAITSGSTRTMSQKGRLTQAKRERERAVAERRRKKAAERAEAKERQDSGPRTGPDEDPDLAGIVPGPQPLQDWQVDEQDGQ